MRRSLALSVVPFALGLALLAGPARAEDAASEPATARARYQAGVTAYASHHYADAILLFLDANRVAPNAALSFDVAQSYDKLGDTSNALAWYRDYLRRTDGAQDHAAVREQHVEPLERRLAATGVQQLTVLSTPSGAELVVDGIGVGTSPWTGNLSPGEHRVSAKLDGFADVGRRIMVPRDYATDVTLSLAASPADGVEPPPRAHVAHLGRDGRDTAADRPKPKSNTSAPGSALRTAGWVTVGAGAASLGGALVFELLRRNAEAAANADPTQVGYERDRAMMDSRQLAARILGGAGAVLSVTGVVLVLSAGHGGASRTEVALDCSPRQVAARFKGSF